jgi:hypothetical protein
MSFKHKFTFDLYICTEFGGRGVGGGGWEKTLRIDGYGV